MIDDDVLSASHDPLSGLGFDRRRAASALPGGATMSRRRGRTLVPVVACYGLVAIASAGGTISYSAIAICASAGHRRPVLGCQATERFAALRSS